MSEKAVIEKFDQLPPEAKKEAGDFVQFLYNQYVKKEKDKSAKKPLSEYGFVGMWKNREDMSDSTDWVRKQRQSQWRNG